MAVVKSAGKVCSVIHSGMFESHQRKSVLGMNRGMSDIKGIRLDGAVAPLDGEGVAVGHPVEGSLERGWDGNVHRDSGDSYAGDVCLNGIAGHSGNCVRKVHVVLMNHEVRIDIFDVEIRDVQDVLVGDGNTMDGDAVGAVQRSEVKIDHMPFITRGFYHRR